MEQTYVTVTVCIGGLNYELLTMNWRRLVNTIERSVRGSDADLCQIALNTRDSVGRQRWPVCRGHHTVVCCPLSPPTRHPRQ